MLTIVFQLCQGTEWGLGEGWNDVVVSDAFVSWAI